MKPYLRFIFDSEYRFVVLGNLGFLKNIPDEDYLKKRFKYITGMELHLDNPQSFNEKIQWLKIYDRKPLYTRLVDKAEVKKWVADRIGEQAVIPTLGVYDSFDDIEIESLPNSFVIKCTHDSGSTIICRDLTSFDIDNAKKMFNRCLKRNLFYSGREWAYKDVKPRIIVEKYIEGVDGNYIDDYKVFNFNGIPKMIQVDHDRFGNHVRNLYTTEWELIDAEIQYPSAKDIIIEKPKCLDKMLEYAKVLSNGMTHVRTDFYCVGDNVFFGEMTFYHGSGTEDFRPKEFGLKVGSWLDLPI